MPDLPIENPDRDRTAGNPAGERGTSAAARANDQGTAAPEERAMEEVQQDAAEEREEARGYQ